MNSPSLTPSPTLSRRAAHLALVVALLLAGPVPLPAQNLLEYEGKTIAAVEVEGLKTVAEETLLYYLELEPGGTLVQHQLNENLQTLWETGLVDDIAIEALPEGDEVRLRVVVRERPLLRSLEFEGLKRVNREEIDDRIAEERIRLYEGDPLRRGELRRLEAAIEELYREKGYRFADAEYTLEEMANHEQRVIFTIDEGDRVRIGDIKFEGNTVFSDLRLRWAMKKTKETNLLWRIAKKDIYNPATLEEDLENIKKLYREDGYKNVVIGDPVVEVRSRRPGAADADDQKRRMSLIIPIEEGDRWKFGQITVEGNEKYTDQQLISAFEIRQGQWLRSKLIDEGVESITNLYKNTGYISARVDTELREQGERIADLVVQVREGDQFRVGRIEFEGNTRTRDKVLRREMRVYEGYVLSLGAVENSLRKIKQLGYFEVDEEDPVQIVNVDEENKTIDLIIKGVEADRTELQFGGGYSGVEGFFGQFALRTKNFLGRGESLGVSVQSGRFREFFDVSYFVPWFLDRPQTVGVRAFRTDTDFDLLAGQQLFRSSQGGTISYGRNFGLFHSANVSYTRSRLEDSTEFFAPDGSLVRSDLNFTSSAIQPAYSYNSVDHPFEPTRGTRFVLEATYAGGVLGGTQKFVRPEVTFTWFKPVTEGRVSTVFGFNAEAGWIEPFDGYRLSRLDRFYLGGDNSVRGFEYGAIWARDDEGNTRRDSLGIVLGGDKFLQANLEYHFLVGGPFRVVAFVDAGGVFAEDQSIDLSHLRYSAGVELRITVPLFGAPLRFIFARNLDPLPEDRFQSFDFSFGASF